jgi:hypothetical protein
MGVRGMKELVLLLHGMVTWIVCSMRMSMGVRGMKELVLLQLRVHT